MNGRGAAGEGAEGRGEGFGVCDDVQEPEEWVDCETGLVWEVWGGERRGGGGGGEGGRGEHTPGGGCWVGGHYYKLPLNLNMN